MLNYFQAVNPGSIFIGLGSLIFVVVLTYLVYRFFMPIIGMLDSSNNREVKYALLEEISLEKIAESKGINLQEELVKRDAFARRRKTFRGKMEEQIFKDWFGEEKPKKK